MPELVEKMRGLDFQKPPCRTGVCQNVILQDHDGDDADADSAGREEEDKGGDLETRTVQPRRAHSPLPRLADTLPRERNAQLTSGHIRRCFSCAQRSDGLQSNLGDRSIRMFLRERLLVYSSCGARRQVTPIVDRSGCTSDIMHSNALAPFQPDDFIHGPTNYAHGTVEIPRTIVSRSGRLALSSTRHLGQGTPRSTGGFCWERKAGVAGAMWPTLFPRPFCLRRPPFLRDHRAEPIEADFDSSRR